MTADADVDDVLRRYLLGSAASEVREDVERRLFSDDQIFWERLCLVEDELIDDYVDEQLDGEDARNFESRFLSTEDRRRKLHFARALRTYVRSQQATKPGLWDRLRRQVSAPVWAAAMLALLIVGLPLATWRLGPARTNAAEVSVWLSPGLVRTIGGQVERIKIPPDSKVLRLHLETDGGSEYRRYRATMHHAASDEIWSQSNLLAAAVDGKMAVTLTLPSELLPPDDYYVKLLGVTSNQDLVAVNRYDFRVLPR